MKIVTHFNPDLDAISSVWLLRRYGGEKFKKAGVEFAPAGKGKDDKETICVDTGLGKFDHHQPEKAGKEGVSAATLVFDWLVEKNRIPQKDLEGLKRLVELISKIDHFGELEWQDPTADYHWFNILYVVEGLKQSGRVDDRGMLEFGERCLDGALMALKQKVKAQKEIERVKQGKLIDEGEGELETSWGKALLIKTDLDEVIKLGQFLGYKLVVKKEKTEGRVRIKAVPRQGIDLSLIFDKIKARDPEATWFFHGGKTMVLNGSRKNPNHQPSKLSLVQLREVLINANNCKGKKR